MAERHTRSNEVLEDIQTEVQTLLKILPFTDDEVVSHFMSFKHKGNVVLSVPVSESRSLQAAKTKLIFDESFEQLYPFSTTVEFQIVDAPEFWLYQRPSIVFNCASMFER